MSDDDVKQQALEQAQQAYGLFIWFVKWFSYVMITLIIIMFMNNWFDDGTGSMFMPDEIYEDQYDPQGLNKKKGIQMKAYHNKGFGMAFFVVFLLLVPLPILGLWAVDGQEWVDRFTTKYFSPWQSECWETAKHERVCKGDNQCKWFRNFCHD